MVINPEQENRWRSLPTPEEWSQVTRLARELVRLDDPAKKRRKLELLSLAQPRLAARLAAIIGLTLAL